MSLSYTTTETRAFTITHAKHMAAKVATDLKRMQRLYGSPSDREIAEYEEEVTTLLRHGYLKYVGYGFKRSGKWIEPSVHYTSAELASADDNDPGRIRPGKNVSGAKFYSYLTYADAWYDELSSDERLAFKKNSLPFQRTSANEPGVDGYLHRDLTYASGGRALKRSTVRGY